MTKYTLMVLALVMASTSSSAHHSTVMFDSEQILLVDGTIKEMQWTNPHGWLQVMVASPIGGPDIEWSIEMEGPNVMMREGWTRTIAASGKKVRVMMNPFKDGRPGGWYLNADFYEDGIKLGRFEAGPTGEALEPTITLEQFYEISDFLQALAKQRTE